MHSWCLGNEPRVFVCDYKILKVAFNNSSLVDKPTIFGIDFYTNFKRIGIINSNGVKWRNIRRFTMCYLKNKGMGKSSLEEVITRETLSLVEDFQKHVDKITLIPWSINVAVINILWEIVAGKRHEVNDKKFQGLNKLVTDIVFDFQSPLFLLYGMFPGLSKLIPNTLKRYLGLRNAFSRANSLKNFLMEVLQQHKENFDENNLVDYIDSYLMELLQHEEKKRRENTDTFTEEELLHVIGDLFGAGSETTSSTIRWILIYMIKYPEIQLKVQQNIDEFVPKDRLPSLQDRDKLSYVDATLSEVMRIKTLVPYGSQHLVSQDMVIDNFRIPKGTTVVSAIEACHNDPDYWDQPHEFNPDRFILPDGSFNGKVDGFLPFGTGRRSCVGESLAKMELYLISSALLQKFSFSSPEDVDAILEPNNNIAIINIPRPCKVIIKERT